MNWNALVGRIHVATVVILVLALVGGISVLLGSLEWESYYKDITVGVGLLGIGRGISSHTGT